MASREDLRVVFEAEHRRLWRSLVAHVGDQDVASEAAAEAFAQALRGAPAIRDPSAWVWRSAFRIAGGLLVTRRRWVTVGSSDPASNDTLPDEVAVLIDALAGLRASDRQVVVLSLVAGLSASEVATIVGSSAGAVRVRLHRARARLRAELSADQGPLPRMAGGSDVH